MKIEVREGVLVDVQVTGFHGLVASDTTPQRKAPLYARAGEPIRIEGTPWAAKALGQASFDAVSYEREANGERVVFEQPLPVARVGSAIVVLGEWEREHLARTPDCVHAVRPDVAAMIGALGHGSPPPGVRAIPEEPSLVAWYAPMGDLNHLLELVRRRAKALFFASDDRGRYEAAWKLVQASPGLPEEMAIAAAMLHRDDFDDWRAVAAMAAPGSGVSETLAAGQGALSVMAAARSLAPSRPSPTPGGYLRKAYDYRAEARKGSFLGRSAA